MPISLFDDGLDDRMAAGPTGSVSEHSNWEHPGSLRFDADEQRNAGKDVHNKLKKKKKPNQTKRKEKLKTVDIDLHSRLN